MLILPTKIFTGTIITGYYCTQFLDNFTEKIMIDIIILSGSNFEDNIDDTDDRILTTNKKTNLLSRKL